MSMAPVVQMINAQRVSAVWVDIRLCSYKTYKTGRQRPT